ncbi:MAG TPA: MFS transporter [Propionicimonas sp.]|nr:MFS transporter [Propionicimonas sp.]
MRSYRDILRLPGALRFSAAGLLARSGQAMLGLGLVLMVSALYDGYRLAGILTAVWAVSWALGTALLSNLVDRYGQRRVMYPAAVVSATALLVVVGFAMLRWPAQALIGPVIVAGAFGGSPGALVRARWKHLLQDSAALHTAFSLESTLDEVTYMVGPVIATALAVGVHPTAGLVAAALSSLLGATLFYSQRATEPPVAALSGTQQRQRPGRVLLLPGVVGVVVVNLLIGAMFGGIDVTVVAAATSWDERAASGLVLGMFSLASALAGLLYGARAWKSALWLRFVVIVVAMFAAAAALLAVDSVIMLTVIGMLFGVTVAPTLINGNSLIGRLVPEAQLTEGLAWMGTGIGIGAAIGSAVCGHVIDLAGYPAGFVAVAGFGLVTLLLALASLPALRAFSAGTKPAPDTA